MIDEEITRLQDEMSDAKELVYSAEDNETFQKRRNVFLMKEQRYVDFVITHAAKPIDAPRVPSVRLPIEVLDRILDIQFTVAWAGEALSEPSRLGWWRTDLVDTDGGGDVMARIAPRTAPWASLQLAREAARRVDEHSRKRHGKPDDMRSIFFLGFRVDEMVNDRMEHLKNVFLRDGKRPSDVFHLFRAMDGAFNADVLAGVLRCGSETFESDSVGRRLEGPPPSQPDVLVARLAAALSPFTEHYPLPYFEVE